MARQTNTGLPLSVSRFSKKQADASTGMMQQVLQRSVLQQAAWEAKQELQQQTVAAAVAAKSGKY